MKANDLEKISIDIEGIYESIENEVKINPSIYKYGIGDSIFVSDEVKAQLMQDGFKISKGHYDFQGFSGFGLIIEW
tara:strand:+ start:304 stop:531 length:228 start_codon:yes stop_codon:yes gene_type:complete